jgi:hypothetical protein
MAAAGAGEAAPNLKRDFLETMFLSKNSDLNRIIKELASGEVEQDDILYKLIKAADWKEFDATLLNNKGRINFFKVLQQLFMFKYFLPKDDRISRKEFEIAMGIQQVRWMVDPENCRYARPNSNNTENGRVLNRYKVDTAEFHLWQDINKKDRQEAIKKIKKQIGQRLVDKDVKYNERFKNTIWYKVDHIHIQSGLKGSTAWLGYGKEQDYYPIPESLNLSDFACVYQPKLVFGTLSDTSLLRFIIKYKQRPYIAHIPGSRSNLCIIHTFKESIVGGWVHDFHHSRGSGTCEDLVSRGLSVLNNSCNLEPRLTYDTLIEAIDDENSDLIRCLKTENGIQLARGINDQGLTYHIGEFPHFRGGARRVSRRRMRRGGRRLSRRAGRR